MVLRGGSVGGADGLTVRVRPPGLPIMHQSWGTLLFMHMPVPAASLRPLIIHTFDGLACVGVTPFAVWGVRPIFLPTLPYLSGSRELIFRTYTSAGCPGCGSSPWTSTTPPPPAEFDAAWTVGDGLPRPRPDSLDFFLMER